MPRPRKKSGSRKVEKRLYIVCEGAKGKSESAYFNAFIKGCRFAGEKVEVKVVETKKNTGRELVREAKKLIRPFPVDSAWVVYDKNGYTKHAETFSEAKDNGIKIAFSSICFEFWILLHFEYTRKAFVKCYDVLRALRHKEYLDYEKYYTTIYNLTKSRLENAKKNAIRLQKDQKGAYPVGTKKYDMNPYTNINELIDEILELQTK
jgi:hypothetical protein